MPQINHCTEKEDMPGNCGLVAELAVFATLPVAEMLFLVSLPNVSQCCTLTARKDNRFLGGTRKTRRSKDSSIDRRIPSYLAVLRLYLDYCKLSIHQERYQKTRMSWAQGQCSGWGLEHLRDWGVFSLEKRQLVGGNLAAASQYLQARLSIRWYFSVVGGGKTVDKSETKEVQDWIIRKMSSLPWDEPVSGGLSRQVIQMASSEVFKT